jgi:hypothetical protein
MTTNRKRVDTGITLPDLYEKLDGDFHFDCDQFPNPRPDGHDALTVEWGNNNYVNANFRQEDAGYGLTMVCRKAITESNKGKTVVLTMPTFASLNLLLETGTELRSLERVPWLQTQTREPWSSAPNATLFISRGSPPD